MDGLPDILNKFSFASDSDCGEVPPILTKLDEFRDALFCFIQAQADAGLCTEEDLDRALQEPVCEEALLFAFLSMIHI